MSLFLHYYLYALSRALSISTLIGPNNLSDSTVRSVSMPLIGLSPFLPIDRVYREDKVDEDVSMPLIGLSPFLHCVIGFIQCSICYCVNALNRALSISTRIL